VTIPGFFAFEVEYDRPSLNPIKFWKKDVFFLIKASLPECRPPNRNRGGCKGRGGHGGPVLPPGPKQKKKSSRYNL